MIPSSDLVRWRWSIISQNQSVSLCMNSRLTHIICFVVITYVILVSQEFTSTLKLPRYVTNSSFLQDYLLPRQVNIPRDIGKKELTDYWRPVTEDIYAYAAYWDTRLSKQSFVRIIGGIIDSKDNHNSIKCLLKNLQNSSVAIEIPSVTEILSEHHNKPCKSVYIKCFVDLEEPPTHVALVHNDWNETWSFRPSWMVVHHLKWENSSSAIGVCIGPMFNYTDTFRIAEFVAYYEALGISNFMFYNYDISEDVLNFFYALKTENYSIDVLPWSLPNGLSRMWHSLGQIASINDCIYRTMAKVKYTVIVDLDEFITPRTEWTLHEFLAIQDVPEKLAGGFIIRSSVFCEEYKPDNLPSIIPPFTTQRNIRREGYIYPFHVRSKYIVKPFAVDSAGIHLIWKFIPGWKELYIPENQALVHHYRSNICQKENKLGKGIIDVKSRKYLNQLMRSKALDVWKSLFSKLQK